MNKNIKSFLKKWINVACIISLVLGLINISMTDIRGDITMEIGSYVTYGRYNNQPIIWQVIDFDESGNPMLMSKDILTYKAFDGAELEGTENSNEFRSEYGNNRWEISNIRQWLNSDDILVDYSTSVPSSENVSSGNNPYDYEKGFLAGFTDVEILGVLNREIKTILPLEDLRYKVGGSEAHEFEYGLPNEVLNNYDTAYYNNSEDKVFLLSIDDISRYVVGNGLESVKRPTEQAVLGDESGRSNIERTSTYWLRTPQSTSATAVRTITADGYVNYDNAYYSYAGIVPAIYLDSTLCSIASGVGTLEAPYEIEVNGVIAVFEDINLESAIREALEKPSGPIYVSEVARITSLDAASRQITNLSGIELLSRVERLNLGYNNLSGFDQVYLLENLTELEIEYNDFESLDFLSRLIATSNLVQPMSINMTGNPIDLTDETIINGINLLASIGVGVNFYEDIAINDEIKEVIARYEGTLADETEANNEKEILTTQLEEILNGVGTLTQTAKSTYEINALLVEGKAKDVISMKREMAKQLKQNGIELNRDLVTKTIVELPQMDVSGEHEIILSEEAIGAVLTDQLIIRTNNYELVFDQQSLLNDFIRNETISLMISSENLVIEQSTVNNVLSQEALSLSLGQLAQDMNDYIYKAIEGKGEDMIGLLNDMTIIQESAETHVYHLSFFKDDVSVSDLYGTLGFNLLSVDESIYATMYFGIDLPENIGGSYHGDVYYSDVSRSGEYYIANNKLAIDDYYEPDHLLMIEYLVSKGIISISDDVFDGSDTISRAEIAAALVKLTHLYDRDAEYYFEDVTGNHVLYSYIASSASKGIVNGYGDGTFRPDNDITQGEFIKMLGAILAYKVGYIYPEDNRVYIEFDNYDAIGTWLIDYMALCIREGVIDVEEGEIFDENQPLTRLEAATLLYLLNGKL